MYAWEAIQNSLEYIEEHLNKEIPIGDLAKTACLSPFYFQRLFSRLVKRPVGEYVKLRRLAKAADELDSGTRILDVAVNYGFSSHANFTRAFKEVYGITPDEYRKKRPMLNTFLKPELSLSYTLVDEGVPLIAGGIVLEICRKTLPAEEEYAGLEGAVSIAGQIPAGESTGVDIPGVLWTSFHAQKHELSKVLDPVVELGMSYLSDAQNGTFTYFAGGLLTGALDPVNPPFIKRSLLPGDYIVCSVEAETFEALVTNALYQAGNYLFGTWLPSHGLSTQPFSAEKYFKTTPEINRLEIWVMPLETEHVN